MLTKITYDRIEEFEFAPGLTCTIRFEDNGLLEVVDKFLRHKASTGEVRRTLKARGSLRYPGTASASSLADKLKEGRDADGEGG
jgi:hypothetical protein